MHDTALVLIPISSQNHAHRDARDVVLVFEAIKQAGATVTRHQTVPPRNSNHDDRRHGRSLHHHHYQTNFRAVTLHPWSTPPSPFLHHHQPPCPSSSHRTYLLWIPADSSYPHVFGALSGPTAPKRAFIIFYSNVVNSKMWCPVGLGCSWDQVIGS